MSLFPPSLSALCQPLALVIGGAVPGGASGRSCHLDAEKRYRGARQVSAGTGAQQWFRKLLPSCGGCVAW